MRRLRRAAEPRSEMLGPARKAARRRARRALLERHERVGRAEVLECRARDVRAAGPPVAQRVRADGEHLARLGEMRREAARGALPAGGQGRGQPVRGDRGGLRRVAAAAGREQERRGRRAEKESHAWCTATTELEVPQDGSSPCAIARSARSWMSCGLPGGALHRAQLRERAHRHVQAFERDEHRVGRECRIRVVAGNPREPLHDVEDAKPGVKPEVASLREILHVRRVKRNLRRDRSPPCRAGSLRDRGAAWPAVRGSHGRGRGRCRRPSSRG